MLFIYKGLQKGYLQKLAKISDSKSINKSAGFLKLKN